MSTIYSVQRMTTEIRELAATLKRESALARAAYSAMVKRGVPPTQADFELAVAAAFCRREVGQGLPDRSEFVFAALGDGRTTDELFPGGLSNEPDDMTRN